MSSWLPPLSCCEDENVTTWVTMSQTEPYESDDSLPYGFIIMSFKASIDFESSNYSRKTLRGLAIEHCKRAPRFEFVREYISRTFPHVSSPENTFWEETHKDGSYRFGRCKVDGLFEHICKFLNEAREKEYNKDTNVQCCELAINQRIRIPDEDLELWHSWYAEMARTEPGFEQQWKKDIGRPRTERELKYETAAVPRVPSCQVVEFARVKGESCPICINEFSVVSTAVMLPCGHIFDQDCIVRWFLEGPCPMCRSSIPCLFSRKSPNIDSKLN